MPSAGAFFSDELQATFTLRVTDDTLVVHRCGMSPQPLRATAPDEFTAGPATLRFRRGERGEVSGYVLDLGRIRNLRFERVAGGSR